jgi:Tol biopolymer transport system component
MLYTDLEPEVAAPSLYESQGDGTGETQLASGSVGGFTDIAYHAGTQRIAFIRAVRNGNGDTLPQIFVAPLDDLESAEAITNMTGTAASHLSWSPDGEKIVFSANFDGDDEIWSVTVSTTSLEQVTDNNAARDLDPSYSPDGEQIVFTSDDGTPDFSAIYVMDADGTNVTRLTEVPISKSPAWSPDGTRIAYINNQQGDDDVYVMDADGQRPFLVTIDDGSAVDSSPVWSPDGEWIFFASNREDQETRWYTVDLQGNWESITVPGRTPQSLSFVTD